MDSEQIDKLAHSDRLTLVTALELLWQNGRSVIQAKDTVELMEGCVSALGTFYAAEKLCEVVKLCKKLAVLETAELIRCIRRSNLEMTPPGADESGICPICGSELEYGDDEPLDDGGVYEWTCPSCGATGEEGYDKVFDKHYNVYDGDGNPYPAPADGVQCTALALPKPAECPPSPCVAADKGGVNALPQADIERLNTYFPREDWNLYFWGFTCFSRQDYARTVPLDGVDEIMLGVECIEGGCLCELAVRWFMLDGKPAPRLDVFDEAWPLFQTPTFAAILEKLTQMSRYHEPTPDEVSALLIAHGFTDQSDRPLERG